MSRLYGVGILACLVAACSRGTSRIPGSDSTAATAVPDGVSDPATLLDSIRVIIGEARASGINSCRVAPLGRKPCGGPAAYVAYSIEVTDSAALVRWIRRYDSVSAAAADSSGLVSDCSVTPIPRPALVGGRCTTAAN